jgi:hypothetical protein
VSTFTIPLVDGHIAARCGHCAEPIRLNVATNNSAWRATGHHNDLVGTEFRCRRRLRPNNLGFYNHEPEFT